MPTRHAKNNTAGSVFTYEEKRKLKWGTQKRRAGKDSIKDWDACGLCLHQATTPVVCQDGHLFCKECIYNYLLNQRQEIKRKRLLYEMQLQEEKEEKQEKIDQEAERKIEAFGEQERGILPSSSILKPPSPRLGVHTGYRKLTTSDGKTAFVVDRDLVENSASKSQHELTKEERAIQKRMTPAFWVPELTPEAPKPKLKPPPKYCVCPAGSHPLRLKQLRPLNLVLADPDSTDRKRAHQTGRYMCPSCRKGLINAGTQHALIRCGHVLCKSCLDQFVKRERRCPVCSEKCRKKDVITLQRGSSGFAAGGAHTAVSKSTPAFC